VTHEACGCRGTSDNGHTSCSGDDGHGSSQGGRREGEEGKEEDEKGVDERSWAGEHCGRLDR